MGFKESMSFRSHVFLLAFGMLLIIAETRRASSQPLDPDYFPGTRWMTGTGYTEIGIPIIRDLNRYHSEVRKLGSKKLRTHSHGRLRILG